MATDGVKIIDGDAAHDNYWGIMDLYDSDIELNQIEKDFPLEEVDYYNDFENEIHLTSIGLAYWEIGIMTPDRLDLIKKVIGRGACIKEWADYDEKEGKARARVLKRYIKKISQVNSKVRKRKKYRLIKNFHLQENDVLSFQLSDKTYRAMICIKIQQYRGRCDYHFVPTTYSSNKKPILDDILNENILGKLIGSGYSKKETISRQVSIEKIWQYEKIKSVGRFFGMVIIAVNHKDLYNLKPKFEKIGSISFLEDLKKVGSFGYGSTFQRFEDIFSDLEEHIQVFKHHKFPVNILM